MWVLLVLSSLLLLGLLGWRLFQQVRALTREVSAASRRAREVQSEAGQAFEAWRAERAESDVVYLAGLDQDVR